MKKTYIMVAAIVIIATAVGVAIGSMGSGFLSSEKYDTMLEKKAEMFGMDVEEVNARLEQGETLKEIFGWDSIAKEDIMAKKQAWMQEWLNTMVEEGKITQEQADEKLEYMQNGTNDCPEECKRFGGHWKGRMGWGMMGKFHKEK